MKKTLVDLTPVKYRCPPTSPYCPSIFKSIAGTYVIIGKTLTPSEHGGLDDRVGVGETAIEISMDLVDEAISTSRELDRRRLSDRDL